MVRRARSVAAITSAAQRWRRLAQTQVSLGSSHPWLKQTAPPMNPSHLDTGTLYALSDVVAGLEKLETITGTMFPPHHPSRDLMSPLLPSLLLSYCPSSLEL